MRLATQIRTPQPLKPALPTQSGRSWAVICAILSSFSGFFYGVVLQEALEAWDLRSYDFRVHVYGLGKRK